MSDLPDDAQAEVLLLTIDEARGWVNALNSSPRTRRNDVKFIERVLKKALISGRGEVLLVVKSG